MARVEALPHRGTSGGSMLRQNVRGVGTKLFASIAPPTMPSLP